MDVFFFLVVVVVVFVCLFVCCFCRVCHVRPCGFIAVDISTISPFEHIAVGFWLPQEILQCYDWPTRGHHRLGWCLGFFSRAALLYCWV